ncbi:hypothetical protein PM082_023564 [Marasmius tenuissimus]|nr:hypothetical protein PM082_023564 [Marasmius tenuissimus]
MPSDTPYFTLTSVLGFPVLTFSVLFFTYGTYTIIFILSIRILTRQRSRGQSVRGTSSAKLYTAFTITLFLLATTYTASQCWYTYRRAALEFVAVRDWDYRWFVKALRKDREGSIASTIFNLSVTLMNTVAECMLVSAQWGDRLRAMPLTIQN